VTDDDDFQTFICGVNGVGKETRFNQPQKANKAGLWSGSCVPKPTKIGRIDHKISIGVKVTEGYVATTEVLVSWTAESLARNQHKIIKRNNKIISRYQ